MNLEGKWSGIIIYRSKHKKYNGEQLYFELVLEQEDRIFQGFSIDTKGLGAHSDPAKIKGKIDEKNISFVKQYPTLHFVGKDNRVKFEKSRKGSAINFLGSFDESKQIFSGEWNMNTKFYILGLIPWKLKQTGSWTMKRGTDSTD